jgi:cation transport ATPase
MMGYLRQIFTTPAATLSVQSTETTAHALRSGLLFGLGQALAVSAKGQSFLWPFLLGGKAIMPWATPAQWCVCLLGAAIGLAILMRRQWAQVWRNLRGATPAPDTAAWPALVLAAIPCLFVQWRWNAWSGHFQAAAAVAVFLLLSAGVLRLAERWGGEARRAEKSHGPIRGRCGAGRVGLGLRVRRALNEVVRARNAVDHGCCRAKDGQG